MKQKGNRLNISENELLEYLDQHIPVVPTRPDGFGITAKEFSLIKRIGLNSAKKALDRLVRENKLKVQQMKRGGFLSHVYYK